MDITYTVLGSDGNQYGPISLETLQSWLREGRINAESQVLRSDLNAWHSAGSYSELGLASAAAQPAAGAAPVRVVATAPMSTPTGPVPSGASVEMLDLDKRIKNGASWFYWIAGLSLINAITTFSGSSWGSALGLTVTQIIAGFASGIGSGAPAVALGLGIVAAGVFVVFGVLANKHQTWAFLVGTVLYGLDTLLVIVFSLMFAPVWIGVAIHIWALVSLIIGVRANLQYNRLTQGQ